MQKIVVLHVMSKTLVILGCATLVFSSLAAEVQTNWVSLFNGKDLTGWTVRGKAAWSVQRGVLVGVGGNGAHLYRHHVFRLRSKGIWANKLLGLHCLLPVRCQEHDAASFAQHLGNNENQESPTDASAQKQV